MKQKWYLSTGFISFLFAFWFLILPLIIGIWLLIKQKYENQRLFGTLETRELENLTNINSFDEKEKQEAFQEIKAQGEKFEMEKGDLIQKIEAKKEILKRKHATTLITYTLKVLLEKKKAAEQGEFLFVELEKLNEESEQERHIILEEIKVQRERFEAEKRDLIRKIEAQKEILERKHATALITCTLKILLERKKTTEQEEFLFAEFEAEKQHILQKQKKQSERFKKLKKNLLQDIETLKEKSEKEKIYLSLVHNLKVLMERKKIEQREGNLLLEMIKVEEEIQRKKEEALYNIEHRKQMLIEKIQILKQERENSRQELEKIYRDLEEKKRELVILEDELLYQSFGFYNPKYNLESSEQYKERLEEIREKQKQMVKDKVATNHHDAWLLNGNSRKGAVMNNNNIKLTIRAFNNECDAAISKVKFNNIDSIEKRIRKAYDTLNKVNVHNQIEIKEEYLLLKLEELFLAYEYAQKKAGRERRTALYT